MDHFQAGPAGRLDRIPQTGDGSLAVAGTSTRRWPEQKRPDARVSLDLAGVRETAGRPALWLYSVSFILFTVQWFAIAAWLPTFLTETQARSPVAAALFSALVVAVNCVGNVGGAWLLRDQYRISYSVIMPSMLILLGVLMLIALLMYYFGSATDGRIGSFDLLELTAMAQKGRWTRRLVRSLGPRCLPPPECSRLRRFANSRRW